MKQSYSLSQNTRQSMFDRLAGELAMAPEIVFAYVYGSALNSELVHDIDVGLYLDDSQWPRRSEILGALSERLSAAIGLSVDARLLNAAPATFLFHVFQGHLLLSRDEDLLTNLLEEVPRRYLDMAPLLRQATKEAFSP